MAEATCEKGHHSPFRLPSSPVCEVPGQGGAVWMASALATDEDTEARAHGHLWSDRLAGLSVQTSHHPCFCSTDGGSVLSTGPGTQEELNKL